MAMTKPRSKKALYIGLPLALAISAGAGFAVWYYGFKDNLGYPTKVMEQADELHERMLSFDSHISLMQNFGTQGNEADKDGKGQFDLVKANRGHLSGAALTIFGWPELWNGANAPHRPTAGFVEEARNQQEIRYKIISGMVRDFPNQVAIAYTPDDFRRLHGEGKFTIFISMLNAYPLGHDLNLLDLWTARGMRMFGFSYIGNNDWADSSRPLPFFNDSPDALDGLSDLGKQAVHRLNDLGVIIDVSQMSTKALDGGYSAQPQRQGIAADQEQRRRGAGGRFLPIPATADPDHPGQTQRTAQTVRPAPPAEPLHGSDAG
jgi:hypothetical protein